MKTSVEKLVSKRLDAILKEEDKPDFGAMPYCIKLHFPDATGSGELRRRMRDAAYNSGLSVDFLSPDRPKDVKNFGVVLSKRKKSSSDVDWLGGPWLMICYRYPPKGDVSNVYFYIDEMDKRGISAFLSGVYRSTFGDEPHGIDGFLSSPLSKLKYSESAKV